MGFATDQRQAFSAALLEVDADARTLCEGWTAYDLAAHCWVREHRPKALLGIASKRFEGLAEAEMARAKELHSYAELAALMSRTPRTPITLLPGADDLVNAAEFFIHTEDVRRPNGLPRRPIDPAYEDVLWKRLPLMGRLFFRSVDVGLVLEREPDGASVRIKPGASTVTIVGRPGEILLFAFGRKDAADVRLIGDAESVGIVQRAQLGA